MHALLPSLTAWAQRAESAVEGPAILQSWIAIVVLLVLVLLGFQYQNHRRRLAEMRLKTLENLARQGHLQKDDIERLLGGDRGLPRGLLIAAWVVMLVGLLFVILAKADFRFDELFFPGALCAVVGLGLISAPFLIREIRRDEGQRS